jgi:hypothetical protein
VAAKSLILTRILPAKSSSSLTFKLSPSHPGYYSITIRVGQASRSSHLCSWLIVAINENGRISNSRAAAMASIRANPLALAQSRNFKQSHLYGKPRTNPPVAVTQPPPPRQLTYVPMQREAVQRQEDLKSTVLRLTKDYKEYGSSNGEWRKISCTGKKFALPPGCAKRKSLRVP